jgi:peptide/nickel transport system substrate-binding protein
MDELRSENELGEDREDERALLPERPLSRRAILGAGVGAALMLPSAIGAATREPLNEATVAAARRGGTIKIARQFTNPAESLDPATPLVAYEYLGALYNRLVKRGPGGRPVPDLAVAWGVSKDAKTWTFNLRRGVTFHNGKPFTSKDAAYTLLHLIDPAVKSPQRGVLSPLISPNSISTPNDRTLVVTLNVPDAEFPSLLMNYNSYVIPDGSGATIGSTGIGTGPFKLTSFKPAQNGTLAVNRDYYGGLANLDAIQFFAIADQQARVNALLAGQVDLVATTNLDFATAKAVAAHPGLTVARSKNAVMYTLPMLVTQDPFTDVRVRQAFKLAYDPRQLLQVAVHGNGTPAYDNPLQPDDALRLNRTHGQDVDKAQFLLRKAGYSNGIDVVLHTSSQEPVMTPLAIAYRDSVKKAGIRVQLSSDPADSYFSKVWIQVPFCVSWWFTGRPVDQLLNEIFRSTAAYNETKWRSARFDRRLDQARLQLNYAKRRAIYQQAQKLLLAESGEIIPFFADRLTGLSKKVQNYKEVGFDFDYLHLALAG